MALRRLCCTLALAMLATVALARPIVHTDAAEEQRFRQLTAQLRCVMCQNQSLADSNAPIAHDLRLEVLSLMREGKSDREIKDFLVARYSDFVLYEPELKPMTWLLWFGPALLVIGGALVIVRLVRKQGGAAAPLPPSNDQEW